MLWGLALVSFATLSYRKLTRRLDRPDDFSGPYTAARMLAAGEDARGFYDADTLARAHGRYSPPSGVAVKPSPPSTSFLLLPLALLKHDPAERLVTAAGLLLLAAVSVVIARRVPLEGALTPGFLCLVFLSRPVRCNFAYGQVYVLVIALAAWAWTSFEKRKEAHAGISLGLLGAFKLAVPVAWPVLLVHRRWRALAVGFATLAVVFVASLPVVGFGAWKLYAAGFPDFGYGNYMSSPNDQTQLSLSRQLFAFNPEYSLHPVADLPGLADFLTGAFAVLVVWQALRLRSNVRLAFGAAVLASLLISPFSAEYHYILALLPIAFLFGEPTTRSSPAFGSALVLGTWLVLGAPDLVVRPQRGWAVLLQYPMVFGAWTLLALTVIAGRNRRQGARGALAPSRTQSAKRIHTP